MSVPGVDVAHLGHGDLSLSLEVQGTARDCEKMFILGL